LLNNEDMGVPLAVRSALPEICRAAEAASRTFLSGHRIFYIGAGTSGRLALLDVAELWPTFGISGRSFKVIIAGGRKAAYAAVEGAEDDTRAPVAELQKYRLSRDDFVLGITASGRTPFVVSGLKFASRKGAETACLTSNPGSEIARIAAIPIVVRTGPEAILGSTRLKAGTSQKLVLNMISTYVGIRSGRVEGNLMVGMKPTNRKLKARAARIVSAATGCNARKAEETLASTGYDIEKSIEILRNK
jgi:N-acetylmuramic acid 6-phosphate etherase